MLDFSSKVKSTWLMLFKIISDKMSEGYSDTRNSRITLIPFEQRYLLILYLSVSAVEIVKLWFWSWSRSGIISQISKIGTRADAIDLTLLCMGGGHSVMLAQFIYDNELIL